ncbi:hypothetical protein, partial [Pseudomonas aeruginosa]|uniref:hypothetical protein n=1 Tax=Pseudomonas aeruginosa TaxID=287 RepID=UPI001C1284D6
MDKRSMTTSRFEKEADGSEESCAAACQKSVRIAMESVSGCSWNECPDQRGITVRMCVEWVSESAWNP